MNPVSSCGPTSKYVEISMYSEHRVSIALLQLWWIEVCNNLVCIVNIVFL